MQYGGLCNWFLTGLVFVMQNSSFSFLSCYLGPMAGTEYMFSKYIQFAWVQRKLVGRSVTLIGTSSVRQIN